MKTLIQLVFFKLNNKSAYIYCSF